MQNLRTDTPDPGSDDNFKGSGDHFEGSVIYIVGT